MMTLFEPDSFPNDWYGWFTNQVTHIFLGLFLTFMVCLIHFLAFGEMPYKTSVLAVIAFGYLSFEIYLQGWKIFDTIEDTVFTVGYGASGALAVFSEVSIGSTMLAIDFMAMLPFFVIPSAHLICGSWYRIRTASLA